MAYLSKTQYSKWDFFRRGHPGSEMASQINQKNGSFCGVISCEFRSNGPLEGHGRQVGASERAGAVLLSVGGSERATTISAVCEPRVW